MDYIKQLVTKTLLGHEGRIEAMRLVNKRLNRTTKMMMKGRMLRNWKKRSNWFRPGNKKTEDVKTDLSKVRMKTISMKKGQGLYKHTYKPGKKLNTKMEDQRDLEKQLSRLKPAAVYPRVG